MSDAAAASHWCYDCNKRVVVETLDELVVCSECNKGFVESIQPIPAAYSSSSPPPLPLSPDLTIDGASIGSHFLQMLRLLAVAPSHRSSSSQLSSYDDDFFRLELNTRNEIEDEDEDDEEDEEDLTVVNQREIFPLATTTRSRTGRNRILDWAEILMGIEDNDSIEFRMESDRYAGNPGDYVDDAAGYEALLQNLAEGDGGGGGRRGAPPAANSAIDALETFEVGSDDKEGVVGVCAVCKDAMVVGETVKKLPCGHCYHGNCIVPWLGTRNSCPVCRFQLKTDDADYEDERRKKKRTSTDSAAASSSRI